MTDRFDIRESESGVVRVFQIDLPSQAIERFVTQAGTGEWPLKYALGATHLTAAFVETIDLTDLGSMSLSSYLTEAHGVARSALADDQSRLDALKGHLLILPSRAFGHKAQELNARVPLRWCGTFEEERARSKGAALRSKSAMGVLTGQSPAGASGPNLTLLKFALLGLAVAVVLLVLFLMLSGS